MARREPMLLEAAEDLPPVDSCTLEVIALRPQGCLVMGSNLVAGCGRLIDNVRAFLSLRRQA